jgi:RsmE family RNA methyltransferase
MNLILFRRNELSNGGKTVQLDSEDPRTKHIFNHLHKKDGETVTVGIIGGCQGKAIVQSIIETIDGKAKKNLILEFDFDTSESVEENIEITLILSLPFPKRLKYLWPQITSMGVTRICIVRGMLSDPDYFKSTSIQPTHYTPLIEEGMSQGCHTRDVSVGIEVDQVLSKSVLERLGFGLDKNRKEEVKIFLDCGDEEQTPKPVRDIIMNTLKNDDSSNKSIKRKRSAPRVVLAVGSERGWTEEEAQLFREMGFTAATLGKSILRVDTAVVAGLAVVSTTLDELSSTK